MADAEQLPWAVPAEVVIPHVANPPPAVVPVVERQPVGAEIGQVQNEVR